MSLGTRVEGLYGRGSTVVLTRCCAMNRVRSVTSFINSSLTLTHGTTRARTGIVMVYNIRFVTRAYGLLDPSGVILYPSLGTNYSLTSDYGTRSLGGCGRRRPNCRIMDCIGAATTIGTLASYIIADNGTGGMVSDFPRSTGVVFNPSCGLNGCVGDMANEGVLL